MQTRYATIAAIFQLVLASCEPPHAAVQPVREPGRAAQNNHAPVIAQRPIAPTPARPPAAPSPQGAEWNPAEIQWQPYDTALARARAERKPVLLVFYAEWCPHCHNYAHVFEDPRIVAKSREFVMVRVDADAAPAVASRYDLDGAYLPRTHFLTAEGTVRPEIQSGRPQYRYFFDERNAGPLLAAMDQATR